LRRCRRLDARSVERQTFRQPPDVESGRRETKGDRMYIGGGFIALIVIILLLVWLF
jgi:hypothetical protein